MKSLRSTRRRASLLLAVMVMGLLAGCNTVEPWQRGNLADYTLRPERDPLHQAMTEHVHFSREGSAGGRGVGGGGCGCN